MSDDGVVWLGAPELEALLVPVGSLTLLPGNPRKGDVDAVARSYAAFGQRKPVVTRTEGHFDGSDQVVVVAGNHQLLAARQLGWTHVAVGTADDLSYAEARAYAAADNRTSELGSNDDALLAALLTEVAEVDPALLAAASYTDTDLADLFLSAGMDNPFTDDDDGVVDDFVPDIDETADPVTQLGDVWELGRHTLVCGDATTLSVPDAAVMVTDPPYGIAHASNMPGELQGRGIMGDDTTEAAAKVLSAWGDRPAVVFWTFKTKIPTDEPPSGCLVWHKGMGGMGDLSFPWAMDWEAVYIYGKGWKMPADRKRSSAVLAGFHMSNRSTGMSDDPDAVRDHPTQKPVSILRELLVFAPPGDVYEPFSGSGSTLLASHSMGRTCHAVEFDPVFVDVACTRFQLHTGIKPTRDGEPYDFTETLNP